MSKLSRSEAIKHIKNWTTDEVIQALKKNGLDECCEAVLKRQIDGDELWELNRAPEEHVSVASIVQVDQEPVSDSGSWGTDFEDDEEDDDPLSKKNPVLRKNNPTLQQRTDFRNSLMMFQKHEKLAQEINNTSTCTNKTNNRPDSIYMNCGSESSAADQENAYMNFEQEEKLKSKTVLQLHKKFEQTLACQLKEQLKLRYPESKPTIKKPEMPDRSTKPKTKVFSPANTPSQVVDGKEIKKPAVPPPRPEKCPRVFEKSDDLPKPPVMLRNFDLVANLPTKTDESEDEYEAFDEQIIEQNRIKLGSNQSLIQKSIENVYKPPSTTSQENQEDYEIYECITESPDDNAYYIQPLPNPNANDPLPTSVISSTIESTPTLTSSTRSLNKIERSPEKKSATLPHSGSNTSLSAEMRATRPLPPPPFGQSYMESSWFHNVTREQAILLIKERARNGYFLLRPSTSDLNNPLVLVLWFKDRVYNVPVRKRTDSRYALGSLKADEQTFATVEEIVKFYSKEELVLYSGGIQMGRTRLTDTPSK
ncbi:Similar to Lcp2: Lymphocyte cytosolic protein 2 (Mus musculus) [Cotesia congregata]|uniref:Similar to Lcp2: Lymphocyte cytosolic protein 2 (Mus musculus) n=1 Tax=Cotesia congregata TaxID=51543 RepID=A0A8J2EIH6_COTCN|nr:Similar to Lcp2: Lymphocyte cytosolic protein 2 (Mus musculus) [Cotesia congregata]